MQITNKTFQELGEVGQRGLYLTSTSRELGIEMVWWGEGGTET